MAIAAIQSLRAKREAVVNEHIEAEAVRHDIAGTPRDVSSSFATKCPPWALPWMAPTRFESCSRNAHGVS